MVKRGSGSLDNNGEPPPYRGGSGSGSYGGGGKRRRFDGGANTNNNVNAPLCTVFVGNLDFKTSWQTLKDHMRRAGNVDSANIIMESGNGSNRRSKGCGLVTYQSPKEAQRALRELNESELDGRTIFVSKDKRADGQHGGGGASAFRAGNPPAPHFSSDVGGGGRSLWVGNVSFDTSWQDLKDHFRSYGTVEYADVPETARGNGFKKGYGLVRFAQARDAAEAVRGLDGTELHGRRLEVRYDREGGAQGTTGANQQLWVGNLSFDCDWQDLKDYFRQCGDVDRAEVPVLPNGRKKGFGLIRYKNPADAMAAVRRLDGQMFQGRNLQVRLDRENSGNSNHSDADRKSSFSRETAQNVAPTRELFVGNLSFDCAWQDLKDYFRQCGDVDRAEVPEQDGGRKRGYGLVRFFNVKDSEEAIRRLNGK